MRILSLLVALIFSLSIGSCKGLTSPPRSVLREALSLQIQLTQDTISGSIELEPLTSIKVSNIRVEDRSFLNTGDKKDSIYLIRGIFDWQFDGALEKKNTPFEVFLEQGARAESWRLAKPAGSLVSGFQEWLTYPLQIPEG